MELMIAAGKAVPILQLEHGLAVVRVYTGSFMTSLDMAGLLTFINSSMQTSFCNNHNIWCRLFNNHNEGRASNIATPGCCN
jgi:dihydroxyacetone kinase